MSKTLTHLDKLLNLPDPMLQFKWVCKSLPFGLPPEYMEDIEVPFNNIAVSEQVHENGHFKYYAGTYSISSFSATFYEDRKATSKKWLHEWKSRIKNFETGACGLPIEYKRDIVVMMLDQKSKPIMTIRLIGCWPSDTAAMSLNYTDGSSRVKHGQTFSVDDQEITFHQ